MQSLEHSTYPVIIISTSNKVMKEALAVIGQISILIDISNDDEMPVLIKASIGTKFVVRWSQVMYKLALQAVRMVAQSKAALTTVNIKRYILMSPRRQRRRLPECAVGRGSKEHFNRLRNPTPTSNITLDPAMNTPYPSVTPSSTSYPMAKTVFSQRFLIPRCNQVGTIF